MPSHVLQQQVAPLQKEMFALNTQNQIRFKVGDVLEK